MPEFAYPIVIILGIDPGIATTGYGVIEKKGSQFYLHQYGIISTKPTLEFSKRLLQLSMELNTLIDTYCPTDIAVEELFFNTNVKTAIIVAQARGVILLCAEKSKKNVASYTPLQVKSSVCGYGRAEKKQVQYMVQKLLNMKELPKPDDAADALAIAICHAHSYKIKSLK